MPVPVIIPAYKPEPELIRLVRALAAREVCAVIVVDDGSGVDYQACFASAAQEPGVYLLRNAVNLGKGAALKSGMNFILCTFPSCAGVVTADADGQHHPDDIIRVAKRLASEENSLIMGVRTFAKSVPFRSRFGNALTRELVRLLVGQRIRDTQTGLRGIPRALLPDLLRLPSSGYEFELDMLITAKQRAYKVLEEPIQTIYLDGNTGSHFNAILDSMRIYFLLLRFSVVSALTAVLDNFVFISLYWATGGIWQSQMVARTCAMGFNYMTVRSTVFHTRQPHRVVLPRYGMLVLCSGLVSYGLINFLHHTFGVGVIAAKILAEALLFVANFTIQRDFVFTRTPGIAAPKTAASRL